LVDLIIKSENYCVIKAYSNTNDLEDLLEAIFERKNRIDFEWLYFLKIQGIPIDIESVVEFKKRKEDISEEEFHWKDKLYINKLRKYR